MGKEEVRPLTKVVHTGHNDPEADAPIIVIHSKRDAPIGPDNPAHCFGPFFSMEQAELFEEEGGELDMCYRYAINLVGPDPTTLIRLHTEAVLLRAAEDGIVQ
jgi:hypothetical protein